MVEKAAPCTTIGLYCQHPPLHSHCGDCELLFSYYWCGRGGLCLPTARSFIDRPPFRSMGRDSRQHRDLSLQRYSYPNCHRHRCNYQMAALVTRSRASRCERKKGQGHKPSDTAAQPRHPISDFLLRCGCRRDDIAWLASLPSGDDYDEWFIAFT